jgi:hypothetical protein
MPNTTASPPNNDFALKTIGETGTVPSARLSNARHAQSLYWRMAEAARPRLQRSATMQGMFDGNPPYDSRKLRARGEAWRANFSSLEGAARKDAAKVPYYDLFSSSSVYADCPTDEESENSDGAYASRCRSEHFDEMLRSWNYFDVQFWTMLDDFIGFNKGYLWWPRPDSWHFKRIPWSKVLFPDGTSVDPDEWEIFAIEHEWPVHRLFQFVKDEKAAKAAGWNVNAVYKAIHGAAPKDVANGNNFNDPMALQAAMKANELYISASCSTVQAASVYTREFDGSWSRMMVITTGRDGSENSSGKPTSYIDMQQGEQEDDSTKPRFGDQDWLFFKQKVGEHVNQILCPFIFEVGNGSINSIEGLAPKIVSAMMAKDRLICEMVSNGMLRSNVTLQAMNGGSRNKAAVLQVAGGGVNVIPEGFTVQNGTIFGDIEAAMAINNDIDRRLDANTGIYRPQFEKPQGNPESATAANIRFSQATVLTNSAVNRFYSAVDKFYAEVYRRAAVIPLPPSSSDHGVKSALEFRRKCKEAGLTDKQIKDSSEKVVSVRAIGNGSPVMRQQTAGALLNLYALMGPRGQAKLKEMYVSAFAGQHGVKALLPVEDTAHVPDRDQWDAQQEEADMHQGAAVVFAPWQNSQTHAVSHLIAGTNAIHAVGQGAEAGPNALFLQTLIPHIAQHVQAIGHPTLQRQFVAQLKLLEQAAQGVISAAQKQMQQQEQASNLSFEQQIALKELQSKMQMNQIKTQGQMQLKAQKQNFDMSLAEQKAKQELAISDASTAADITRKSVETKAGIEHDRLKAEAHAEAAKEKAKQKPESGE